MEVLVGQSKAEQRDTRAVSLRTPPCPELALVDTGKSSISENRIGHSEALASPLPWKWSGKQSQMRLVKHGETYPWGLRPCRATWDLLVQPRWGLESARQRNVREAIRISGSTGTERPNQGKCEGCNVATCELGTWCKDFEQRMYPAGVLGTVCSLSASFPAISQLTRTIFCPEYHWGLLKNENEIYTLYS